MWTSFAGSFCLPQFRRQVTAGFGFWMILGQGRGQGQHQRRRTEVCSVSLNWVEQLMLPTFTFEVGLAFVPQIDPIPRRWVRYSPNWWLWSVGFPRNPPCKASDQEHHHLPGLPRIWTLLLSKLNLNIWADKRQAGLGWRKSAPRTLIGWQMAAICQGLFLARPYLNKILITSFPPDWVTPWYPGGRKLNYQLQLTLILLAPGSYFNIMSAFIQ